MINSPASSASQSRINIASLVISAVVASFVADAAQAQTVWTGAEDSDWNNAANWSDGVPGETDRVTISRDLLVSGSPNQPQPVDNQPVLDGGDPRAVDVVFLGSLAGAELTIRNGAQLTLNSTTIGVNIINANPNNRLFEQSGTLNVTGNDSLLTTNSLEVGFYGSGTASFSDGADLVVDGFVNMGGPEGSQDSTLSFDGVGTTATLGALVAGATEGSTVSVTNGARVTAGGATIGQDGPATMEVSGAGSNFTVTTGTLNLALRDGSGTLNIRDGGTVDAAARMVVGTRNDDATATVTIDGAGSALTVGEVFVLGNHTTTPASGTASVTDGGRLQANQVMLGWFAGSSGDLEASGAESRIAVETTMRVGFNGEGVATLSDGATLEAAEGAGTTTLRIAENAGSTGTVNIGAARGAAAVGAGIVAVDEVRFGPGTAELVFNHNTEGYQFAPYFTGIGTISHLSGETTLTADSSGFAGTTNVEGGSLLLREGALGGTLNVLNGGTFGGSGTVSSLDVATGGNLAPVGTLTVQGDASFDAGSFYLVDADPTGSDFLSVTGTLTVDGGTVRHQESTADFNLLSRYRIALAEGGVQGEFDGVTSELAFMTPELSYTGTEVWMDLSRNDIGLEDIALTSNQRSLSSVLSGLDENDPLIQTVLTMSPSSARQAYEQLAGEIHGSRASAVVQDVVVMQETLLHRLREQRNTPSNRFVSRNNMSADPAGTSGAEGVWMEGFGSWSDFDGDGNTVGTRRDSGGFALGHDYQMSNGLQVGILAGYSNSSIRNDAGASSDADGTTFGLYFSTDENRPGLQWSGGVLMSEYDVETMRSLSTVGTDIALGEYDARSYSIFAEASYMHQVGRYALEPFFGLTHVAYDSDDFTETGSTSALTVSGVSTNTTFATLGLRGVTPLDGLGVNTVATGMLGWRHAFGDTDPLQSASLLGNAFDVQGMPVARNELMIEAGLDIALSGSSTFNVSYSGRLADNFADHGLRLGLNVSF
ncbi:autotransporter domain-containing protein [Roseobacter sp. HKCCD7577]|uniref:autotransporter outer membrane beta-barrel domain-containing protein n=1 Tax=Roseobacter sp. HKCCD7577 TaxID=2690610 RepID=UPI0014911761|nr:autotransporter domain-containing protein [Roseobacter sp. HKCCD7577]